MHNSSLYRAGSACPGHSGLGVFGAANRADTARAGKRGRRTYIQSPRLCVSMVAAVSQQQGFRIAPRGAGSNGLASGAPKEARPPGLADTGSSRLSRGGWLSGTEFSPSPRSGCFSPAAYLLRSAAVCAFPLQCRHTPPTPRVDALPRPARPGCGGSETYCHIRPRSGLRKQANHGTRETA